MDSLALLPSWLWIGLVALFGLIVGSFLNVVAHRLPTVLQRRWLLEAQQILDHPGTEPDEQSAEAATRYHLHWPPSHCPHCQHRLRIWENIPLISYLMLRGRCHSCAARISVRYPLLELISAIAAATVAATLGPTVTALVMIVVTWTLIAAAAIDYEHYLLPDALTLPLLWAGLLWSTSALSSVSPEQALYGAAAGYLSLWLIYHGHRALTGREGMGYGDFKLTAALGAWLGWQALPLLVLLAAVGGLVGALALALRNRPLSRALPFGPLLAVAGWILLVWGEQITYF
ncbi:prepilin peptidase [Halorhodospira abdelmalekii]|uniref:prepilin peptidase n=1 Tax=Halorhodospira abdelmalekii TaxID=421629 RepID=UPI0019041244|nr:A24 family peptidase [Halorhodospira abdelmalekii]MBK1734342.1 prepilin peptidase [Halorhodospira abdelmalekii]